MTKDRVLAWVTNAAVALMFAAIPFGAFMGLYTNNSNWFWLCGFIIIFLS